MIGTILNAAGILIGGTLGLTLTRQLSAPTQAALKGLLGVLIVFVGLKTTWTSLGPGIGLAAKQMTIVILAMMLGKLTGQLLRFQKGLNKLGHYAKEKFSRAGSAGSNKALRWSEGFITCTILFCVGPMAILGSIQDGLDGRWQTLGIKAVMDGVATMAFTNTFGWGAILSVVPVVAYQGTLTLAAKWVAPHLQNHAMMDSINATGGLLIFCIALIILEFRQIKLADYLPSLVYAPMLTWVWK
jgi:uncharacterized membrane protein YqgA involved in biofilm formation